MLSIIKSPQAEADVLAVLEYLEERNPSTADRFLVSLNEGIEKIAAMPELGSPWESDEDRLENVRYWQIADYPNYLVFYKPIRRGILIMRVLHGAHDIGKLLGELRI